MLNSNHENDPSLVPDLDYLLEMEQDSRALESVHAVEDFAEIEQLLNDKELNAGTLHDELVDLCKVPSLNGDDCNAVAEQTSRTQVHGCPFLEEKIQPASKKRRLDNCSIDVDSEHSLQHYPNRNNVRESSMVEIEPFPFSTTSLPVEQIEPETRLPVEKNNSDFDMTVAKVHQLEADQLQVSSPHSVDQHSQHGQPIDNNKVSIAMVHFYDAAYRWFNLSRPNFMLENQCSDPVCQGGYLPVGHEMKGLVLSKTGVMKIIEAEMRQGKDVTDECFMETFANVFLNEGKFEHMCVSCESFFKRGRSFSKHFIRLPGWKGAVIKCPYRCGASFLNLESLKRHVRSTHWCGSEKHEVEPGVFRCSEEGCGKQFQSRKGLTLHLSNYHNYTYDSKFCALCKTFFESNDALRVHLRTKHGVRDGDSERYVCDVEGCNKRCRTENGINQHKKIKHKNDDKTKGCNP